MIQLLKAKNRESRQSPPVNFCDMLRPLQRSCALLQKGSQTAEARTRVSEQSTAQWHDPPPGLRDPSPGQRCILHYRAIINR